MASEKHILSKSTFMRGCQCIKSLYLNKHRPKLRDKISEQQQAVFDRGTSVGELARKRFPGGWDASPEHYYDYSQSLADTKKWIEAGQRVIYEAAFQCDGVLVAIDILVKEGDVWKGYEVKSSTAVKEPNILDAALQYYVITRWGIALEDISIIYLNNQYVRHGPLDIAQLFYTESVLEPVKEAQEFIVQQLPRLKEVLLQSDVPAAEIGPPCYLPYPCDFKSHCWQGIPFPSVFDIAGLSKKKQFALYQQGIVRFEDIPPDAGLNELQRMQVHCHLHKEDVLDRSAVINFLTSLSYPLYFLDFETINPGIPLYDGSRPYQQIPFQYSIHYKKNREGELRHTEFLAPPIGDPRPAFIEMLVSKTSLPGDILTYNASFEKGRLRELARDFPDFAIPLEERISRIRDLLPPFKERHYYTPSMNGGYSIKDALPALVPELSYEHLPINNGGDASLYFEKMIFDPSSDHAIIRKNLLTYCRLDTLAMVRILEKLESLV